jgi:hypothetical protein
MVDSKESEIVVPIISLGQKRGFSTGTLVLANKLTAERRDMGSINPFRKSIPSPERQLEFNTR